MLYTYYVMNSDAQKNYFDIAYRTGSDVWTHIPYHTTALRMMPPLPHDSFILDVGVGRGLWLMHLIEEGYRVIGLDYIQEVVKHGNKEIKFHHKEDRGRFIYGDVRDIPLTDQSFDAITDIGVLQHLDPSDWNTYISEVKRVLKPEGYVLNVSLSKETNRFLGFHPKTSDTSLVEKFGVSYYFFTADEMNHLFESNGFILINQQTATFDARTDPGDAVTLLFSLYKLA